MATFRILLFSVLKQKVGKKEIHVEMEAPTTGEALLDRLLMDYPVITDYRPILRIAINQEYALEDRMLTEGDEIALITPVSGG